MASLEMRQLKLFVTGGTGFLGGHFINEASGRGCHILSSKRVGSTPRVPLKVAPNWVERESREVFLEDFSEVDCFVHFAACGVGGGGATWADAFDFNVVQSLRMWTIAAKAGVRNFVIVGSCVEYGKSGEFYDYIPVDAPLRPTNPYAASKAAATVAASAFAEYEGVKVKVLRPFQVFGPGEEPDRMYAQVLRNARSGLDMKLTGGAQIRDYMDVGDCARIIFAYVLMTMVASRTPGFSVSNLGTGVPCSLRQFVETVWLKEGGKGELLFGAIPYRPGEVMRYVPLVDLDERREAMRILGESKAY